MIMVGDTVFVHGGLPPALLESDIPTINASVTQTVADYNRIWDGVATRFEVPVARRGRADALRGLGDEEAAAAAAQLETLLESDGARPGGAVLDSRKCVVPRTHPVRHCQIDPGPAWRQTRCFRPTRQRSRGVSPAVWGGLIVMADTGMLRSYYEGTPAALIIEGDNLQVRYAGSQSAESVDVEIRRVGERPGNLNDDQLEEFLANAEIVATEEVGTGVTKPLRVTLERDGISVQALFKGVSTPISGNSQRRRQLIEKSDRYQHEVAAYKLDRLLDLNLVPVTVERTVNGNPGALQFWVNGMISLLEKTEQNVKSGRPLSDQPAVQPDVRVRQPDPEYRPHPAKRDIYP